MKNLYKFSCIKENKKFSEPIENHFSDQSGIEQEHYYHSLLTFLTSLDMNEEDAKKHYFSIIQHREEISEKLDRNVGFRVATLDYFMNVETKFTNPKIIEVSLLEEILSLSKEDVKTGCLTHHYFKEIFCNEQSRCKRYDLKMSLLILDIDDFKAINDTHGHLFGDKILKRFSQIIKSNLRLTDSICRFGGDEFIVMLPQTGRFGARIIAERIKENLVKHLSGVHNHIKTTVTFSGGISTYPLDGENYDDLIEVADKFLYIAKKAGKNRVNCHLQERFRHNNVIETMNKRQYKRHEINQPVIFEMNDFDKFLNISGRVINLSQGGALLELTADINKDYIQKLQELQEKGIEKTFKTVLLKQEVISNIVHLEENDDNLTKLRIGVSFDNTIDFDKMVIPAKL